jgi:hypothetical protein
MHAFSDSVVSFHDDPSGPTILKIKSMVGRDLALFPFETVVFVTLHAEDIKTVLQLDP